MSRILKTPEIRKQEILDTAMKLFRDKGYDATSIADIAKAMHVVPGLCYRYFGSKQEIFNTAVKQYAQESSEDFLLILKDPNKPFKDRLDSLFLLMLHKEENSKYHNFYHKQGNETFHFQLAMEMYKYIAPKISNELSSLCKKGELSLENPAAVTDFILLGQINLWLSPLQEVHCMPLEERICQIQKYTYTLLGIKY